MWFQVAVGAGFIAMAIWALVPDKDDEGAAKSFREALALTVGLLEMAAALLLIIDFACAARNCLMSIC